MRGCARIDLRDRSLGLFDFLVVLAAVKAEPPAEPAVARGGSRALTAAARDEARGAPRRERRKGLVVMLRIYDVMLGVLRGLKGSIEEIEKRDADLARQLRRAASSVTLNVAEGSGSAGGVRRARYRTALGSAREARACLETAEALGYLPRVDESVRAGLVHVVNVLRSIVA